MALVEPSAPSLILWDLELDEPVQVCRIAGSGTRQDSSDARSTLRSIRSGSSCIVADP
jgi:hypothetical protein